MTEKERYLDEQIATRLQYWIGKMLLLGILFFPFIGIADYFVTPENLERFTLYRLVVSCILLVVYYLNKRKRSTPYQHALIAGATILSALVIETMILQFHGHASTYYAGLNLLIIAALGLIPYGFTLSLSLSIVIYVIYVLPILLFDVITDPATFIANNVFMICTFVLVLTWRVLSQKSMINELSHQYDLVQDKKKLEEYSSRLELLLKELHRSEQWHRSLFENATDGIVVLDPGGTILNVNEKACEMHGFARAELLGAHITVLENGNKKEELAGRMRQIASGEQLVFETAHQRKDGTPLYLEISSKAITIGGEQFIQSFYRDITERRKLQEHFLQSQKMESIGLLAGGIAHDFNNILTAVLGHTEIIRRSAVLEEKPLRSLNVIEDASRRAGRMISKLLGFARKSKYELTPLNLNDVVYDTVKLLEHVIDRNIHLGVELDNRLPLILGDINQLEQVIMNLIVNARDAMPQGGRIAITTHSISVVKGMPDVPPFVQPGEYIRLNVADTGAGIPETLHNKIFEPFFTTKERGRGTGLGLSMVYGTVKEHQGYISVKSEVGAGSTFSLYLPASPVSASVGVKMPSSAADGEETVLVVDDDRTVLNAMRDTLTDHGYNVYAVGDPAVALEVFQKISNDVSLVITDIVMPECNGQELIRRIKAVNPDVKILAVSGYTRYVAEQEELKGINGFLQKPFEPNYLLQIVRHILDARPDGVITM